MIRYQILIIIAIIAVAVWIAIKNQQRAKKDR